MEHNEVKAETSAFSCKLYNAKKKKKKKRKGQSNFVNFTMYIFFFSTRRQIFESLSPRLSQLNSQPLHYYPSYRIQPFFKYLWNKCVGYWNSKTVKSTDMFVRAVLSRIFFFPLYSRFVSCLCMYILFRILR